jgi:hypothetical protein
VLARWRRGFGSFLVLLGIAATFVLSTNGAALLLARHLAVPVVAANLQQVQGVQGMASLMLPQGARRIALVTDWSHMPRAAAAFRRVGFEVLEAPTDFPIPRSRPVLEWLPSSAGAASCRELIREWLGRVVVRIA